MQQEYVRTNLNFRKFECSYIVASWPASGSCTVSLFGWNYQHILYDGATATTAKYDTQRMGWNSGDTSITTSTTASPGHVCQLFNDDGTSTVSDILAASSTSSTMNQRGSRMVNIPDSNTPLYIQIRCVNGTTAPTSITWTMGFVSIEEFSPVPTTIHASKQTGGGNGLPVNIMNSPSVAVSSITAGANLVGDVGIQYRANSTGAATGKHLVSASSTNATNVKASAGRVVGWSVINTCASWRYVKLHNTAGAPTAGAGVVQTIAVPPSGVNNMPLGIGIGFATGIAFTTVGGTADADTTAIGAGELIIDIFYA